MKLLQFFALKNWRNLRKDSEWRVFLETFYLYLWRLRNVLANRFIMEAIIVSIEICEFSTWLPPQTAKEPHIRPSSNFLLSFGHLLEFQIMLWHILSTPKLQHNVKIMVICTIHVLTTLFLGIPGENWPVFGP